MRADGDRRGSLRRSGPLDRRDEGGGGRGGEPGRDGRGRRTGPQLAVEASEAEARSSSSCGGLGGGRVDRTVSLVPGFPASLGFLVFGR